MQEIDSTQLIYAVDLTGTFVFAVSGWLIASKKELDFFGASVIAFITAVGGGTLRDVLIGSQPVGWMADLNYLVAILAGIVAAIFFKRLFEKLRKTMFLFDSIGIGLFTILGLEKTLSFGLSPVVAIMMGTISAVFGGVLRDTLVNEIPLIFRKEIYATVCLSGGILYWLMGILGVNADLQIILTIIYIISFRILSVVNNWSFRAIK
ncbi:trimeric intracellular cation channel family protein [Roseivirga pacifica]|uniref:trimeric intracellular cation channel family protein n=1 Tax=Roseivirga pacifica TaxID=1267423 RepID=UPI003BB1B7BE